MDYLHIPIMLNEVIENFNIKEDGIYVDGTIGGAGHSIEIVKRLKTGKLIGIDRDEEALEASRKRLSDFPNVELVHGNHDNIKQILEDLNIEKVDGILLDLGVSSYQLDEKQRGFSYLGSNVLDMRMDKTQEKDAIYVLNKYAQKDLEKILYEYGEEKFARNIVQNICEYRKLKTIKTTDQLVDIIEKSIPARFKKNGHPAKKTFQAIRIEVNDELEPLYDTVKDCVSLLKENGILQIITFHSLEDRIVKETMKYLSTGCMCPKDLPYCICNHKADGKLLTKKPIIPTQKELEQNSRAKSAKLRVFEKI